jgi:ATP-dependent DNA helicase DinG
MPRRPSAAELLGPEGPLAKRLPGYEVRPGQLNMAQAVEATLARGGVLLTEAGTGTGKTLAYLVPALLSGKKVVVSTATRALEDQIYHKDLPLVRDYLGLEPSVVLMKGLNNYLCRRRYAEFLRTDEAASPRHARALGLLAEWVQKTERGDLSELGALAEDDPIWLEVAASSEMRMGSSCPTFEDCFVTHMKRAAEMADVVVINHHLFFADLAVRGPHPGRVLPDYHAIVLDEAHQLEEVATSFFGVRVSRAGCERLERDARRVLTRAGALDSLLARGGFQRSLDELERASGEFWELLGTRVVGDGTRSAFNRDEWAGDLAERYFALDAALENLANLAGSAAGRIAPSGEDRPALDVLELLGRRSMALRGELGVVADGAPGQVTWLEADSRRVVLGASPVELADLFRQKVFARIPCVVLTSATLSGGPSHLTGGDAEEGSREITTDFGYLRARLGLDATAEMDGMEVEELVVPSPFDYANAALLYTPGDLPNPSEPAFLSQACSRIDELIRITDGGAFVLTTSLRSMHELDRRLRMLAPARRILVQGRAPKQVLLEEFRTSGSAVLIATMSFWEGVDVPGHALRLVILEKIPFGVPTDPVMRARGVALEERGYDSFMELFVPAAAITLKQGFGRLIRTRSDRGIVALLDGRVLRRGYGKRLLRGLPPATRTDQLDRVREFWLREAGEG